MIVNAILLVNGKYALQLRDKNAKRCPGMWGLFGGSVEEGESDDQALRREIFEELELLIGRLEHVTTIAGVRFYSTDVSERWRAHRLHEGERADLFSFAELPGNTSELARQAIIAHMNK